jgi:hypothetical protein
MPQHLSFITLTIVLLTTLTFLAFSNPIQYLPREWQQLYSTLSQSYTAPITGCDGTPEDIVEDSYRIYLHRGYSIEQHKTLVIEGGVDWDSCFGRVQLNETLSHGLVYRGTFDKDALAIVRADIGVDLVNCDKRLHPA